MSEPPYPVAIRAPAGQDHSAWQGLWTGYQAFYKVDLPPEVMASTWARILDPAEPVWAALAWQDGQAVGLAHWLTHRSTWSVPDVCYLHDLFVAPSARGGGIGRRLIEHVRYDARRHGCTQLYWLTHETNRQAMKLYDAVAERTGFVHYMMDVPV